MPSAPIFTRVGESVDTFTRFIPLVPLTILVIASTVAVTLVVSSEPDTSLVQPVPERTRVAVY